MKVGIELSGIPTSDRARGAYLVNELKSIGFDVCLVDETELVDLRIMLKRDRRALGREKNGEELRVFDVSDAILIPPINRNFLLRIYQLAVVNRRYSRFLTQCDAVVAASRAQQISMRRYNSNVYVIPDSSYYHPEYDQAEKPDPSRRVIFVWDGQGHNFPFLEYLIGRNTNFFRKNDVLLKVVTDRIDRVKNRNNKQKLDSYRINSEFIDWNVESFMREVNAAHVGLAPINLACPHSRAKPDNKIVNYQGLGLTAIASSTMAYSDYAKASAGGVIICKTDEDWRGALEYWRLNRMQSIAIGSLGRQFVLDNYTTPALARMWQRVIHDVLASN